jgi:hypothetical protein
VDNGRAFFQGAFNLLPLLSNIPDPPCTPVLCLPDAFVALLTLLLTPFPPLTDLTRSMISSSSNFALFHANIAFLNCSYSSTCGSYSSPFSPSSLEALLAKVAALELPTLEAESLASEAELAVAIFGRK